MTYSCDCRSSLGWLVLLDQRNSDECMASWRQCVCAALVSEYTPAISPRALIPKGTVNLAPGTSIVVRLPLLISRVFSLRLMLHHRGLRVLKKRGTNREKTGGKLGNPTYLPICYGLGMARATEGSCSFLAFTLAPDHLFRGPEEFKTPPFSENFVGLRICEMRSSGLAVRQGSP